MRDKNRRIVHFFCTDHYPFGFGERGKNLSEQAL
jgi:hypothetical protein